MILFSSEHSAIPPGQFHIFSLVKLQLHDAMYSAAILFKLVGSYLIAFKYSLNDVASTQKNRGDKSHHVIVA